MHRTIAFGSRVALALAAAALIGCAHDKTVGVANATQHPTPVNQRVASEGRINAQDADQLHLAWSAQTPANVTHMPLLWQGNVYFADWDGTVSCAKAETGQIVWQKHLDTPQKMWPVHGFAGTGAIGHGMLFEATAEGDAYALDLYSGETVWHQKLSDDPNAGSTATPLFNNDRIYFGLGSADQWIGRSHEGFSHDYKPSSRGEVLCLDARNGHLIWRHELVDRPDNGAPVRGGFALDGESNTLFFTTGNNYRGAATELAASIVAMNAQSGQIRWHFKPASTEQAQREHAEDRDRANGEERTNSQQSAYAFAAAPNLFDVGGRKLVGAGSLDGKYYALDRDSGQMVWSRQVGDSGVSGGIRASASFRDGRLYLWSNNNFDDTKSDDPASRPMSVACLDAGSGKVVWQMPNSQPAAGTSSGILVNDVYFVGSLDGTLRAYRASDGQVAWTGRVRGGSIASSINAAGNAIFVGAGLPKSFDGMNDNPGVYCFSTVRASAQPAGEQQNGGR